MDYTNSTAEDIKKWLSSNLDEERFKHSYGTAETALSLAKKYGVDEEKAFIAGLLHDCAKCLPKDKQLDIINSYLNIEDCEMINPKTYHAPVGAYYAKEIFGVEDTEILSAIRWHTLGKLNMTTFEKVIFLADKIEPYTRDKEYINKIKSRLDEYCGLDKALLECFKATIKSLAERNLKICISTVEIYNELLNKYE